MKTSESKGIFNHGAGIIFPSYKEQAYDLIKSAILFQRMKPGELYTQEDICNELGISRTPVREALLELQREGFIRFNRGRGINVVQITKEEAREIMEMRIHNEIFGAKLAAKRAVPEQIDILAYYLEEIKEETIQGDVVELYKKDCAFHRAVMEASQNKWLCKHVESLRDHFLRFENKITLDALESRQKVLQEHTAIYNAIVARMEDDAEQAMRHHLVSAFQRTAWEYLDEMRFDS